MLCRRLSVCDIGVLLRRRILAGRFEHDAGWVGASYGFEVGGQRAGDNTRTTSQVEKRVTTALVVGYEKVIVQGGWISRAEGGVVLR